VRIGKVAISKAFRSKPEVKKLIADCRLQDSQVVWTSGRQTARIGDFKMEMFSPTGYMESDNDASIVCRISDSRASCLFTGDISSTGEYSLMKANSNSNWNAQILKVSHHGSRFSTGDAWLNTVKPEYAVISVGRNNNYGHPATDVLRRLNLHQTAILRTDLQGDLKFIRTSRGFALEDEKAP
jgi:competence protein ComEC